MMNMLEAILRRPRTIITVMLVMMAAGITAYITLPKENQPAIDVPFFFVSVTQTGLSPADADRLLVRPLETELGNISGLKSMRSTSYNGGASVVLEFDINFDKRIRHFKTPRIRWTGPKAPCLMTPPTRR